MDSCDSWLDMCLAPASGAATPLGVPLPRREVTHSAVAGRRGNMPTFSDWSFKVNQNWQQGKETTATTGAKSTCDH